MARKHTLAHNKHMSSRKTGTWGRGGGREGDKMSPGQQVAGAPALGPEPRGLPVLGPWRAPGMFRCPPAASSATLRSWTFPRAGRGPPRRRGRLWSRLKPREQGAGSFKLGAGLGNGSGSISLSFLQTDLPLWKVCRGAGLAHRSPRKSGFAPITSLILSLHENWARYAFFRKRAIKY